MTDQDLRRVLVDDGLAYFRDEDAYGVESTLFCVFSPNSIDFRANYVIVVEDRLIMSKNNVYHLQSSKFGNN